MKKKSLQLNTFHKTAAHPVRLTVNLYFWNKTMSCLLRHSVNDTAKSASECFFTQCMVSVISNQSSRNSVRKSHSHHRKLKTININRVMVCVKVICRVSFICLFLHHFGAVLFSRVCTFVGAVWPQEELQVDKWGRKTQREFMAR